jgi:hypothetical protein
MVIVIYCQYLMGGASGLLGGPTAGDVCGTCGGRCGNSAASVSSGSNSTGCADPIMSAPAFEVAMMGKL